MFFDLYVGSFRTFGQLSEFRQRIYEFEDKWPVVAGSMGILTYFATGRKPRQVDLSITENSPGECLPLSLIPGSTHEDARGVVNLVAYSCYVG